MVSYDLCPLRGNAFFVENTWQKHGRSRALKHSEKLSQTVQTTNAWSLYVTMNPCFITRVFWIMTLSLHFLDNQLTLQGQGCETLGELEDFSWQPPAGGKRS